MYIYIYTYTYIYVCIYIYIYIYMYIYNKYMIYKFSLKKLFNIAKHSYFLKDVFLVFYILV